MNDRTKVQYAPRPGPYTVLKVVNWGVFGFLLVSALSWLAVSLMVIPYPRMLAGVGGEFGIVLTYTAVFTGLALVSGIALWLLSRGHGWRWYGQAVLALAVIGTLVWAMQVI